MNKYALRHIVVIALLVSILSSMGTLLILKLSNPPVAEAQSSIGSLDGMTLYAGSRRDTEKDESFIFFDPKTKDIWVYRNEDLKEHYRISKIGDKLEKIK